MTALNMEWSSVRVLKFFSMIVLLASFSLILRPNASITHRPIVEDGYYALSIATNIASGNGITIDGLHQTNGFQPLFTFLTVPAFLLARGDQHMAIRYVLFIHWIVSVLAAFTVASTASLAIEPEEKLSHSNTFWWIFFLFVSNVLVFVVNYNGLETGFLLFLYSYSWWYYQRTGIERWHQLVIFAIILGLLVLTRIDAVFFVIVFSLYQLISGSRSIMHRLGRFVMLGAISFTVSAPWWIFNFLNFGSFLPTSGKAYQSWITLETLFEPAGLERVSSTFVALTRVMMPIIYLGQNTLEGFGVALVKTCLILAGGLFLWRLRGRIEMFLDPGAFHSINSIRAFKFLIVFVIACALLVGSYALTFSATWFFTRYFSPLLLVSLVIIGVILSQVRIMKGRMVSGIVAGLLTLPLLTVIILLHIGNFRSEFIDDQIPLVQDHVPPENKVAAFQTGTLGFFRRSVVNLDGKVNPEAVKNKEHLLEYVQENKIEWLCDEPKAVLNIFGEQNLLNNGWRVVETKGRFALFHRVRKSM